jgi:hypothetical protein
VPEEKGEDEVHANCEPRRTEDRLTEETEIDAGGGSDIRWRGGEAAGGRRGQAQQGARRQRCMEQMEKKTERKGSKVGSRWLLKALGCTGRQGKKEGVGSVPRGGRRRSGEGPLYSSRQRPSAVRHGR